MTKGALTETALTKEAQCAAWRQIEVSILEKGRTLAGTRFLEALTKEEQAHILALRKVEHGREPGKRLLQIGYDVLQVVAFAETLAGKLPEEARDAVLSAARHREARKMRRVRP